MLYMSRDLHNVLYINTLFQLDVLLVQRMNNDHFTKCSSFNQTEKRGYRIHIEIFQEIIRVTGK